MAYKERGMDIVAKKPLITALEAGKLVGIGRDQVRRMAVDDLEDRGIASYAVRAGEKKILIKRVQFLHEVAGYAL